MEQELLNPEEGNVKRKSSVSRTLFLLAVITVITLGICFTLIIFYAIPNGLVVLDGTPPESDFQAALQDLTKLGLGSGTHTAVDLPPSLGHLSQDGKVNAVVTPNGRLIVLFKTHIGWKENYEGFVYSDAPLRANELGTDSYGRSIIQIVGLDKDYPVIQKQLRTHWFEVYFDLN